MVRLILLLAAVASAQQVYENRSLNAIYEAPAGWVFDTPDTSKLGTVAITPNRVGLNPDFIYINLYKHGNTETAFYFPGSDAFWRMSRFYASGSTSTKAPTATVIQDTTIGAVHYCHFVLKQIDLDAVQVYYGASNQVYAQTFTYVTTLDDYNTNKSLYEANWNNLGFISTTGAPTASKLAASPTQAAAKKALVDILGRRLQEPTASPRISTPIR